MKTMYSIKRLLATLLTLAGLFAAISATSACWIIGWEEPKMPNSLIYKQ